MSRVLLTTRPLPLPEIEIDGQSVNWVAIEDQALPNHAIALVSTSLDAVDAKLIKRLPETVKLIANLGIGVDNIDLEAARSRGIAVSNTPVVTEDTADLSFALLLSACRKIGLNERFVRGGSWSDAAPMAAMGLRVHGATLGLVGFGKIAKAVARRAMGFEMKVLYYTPNTTPGEYGNAKAMASLDELVAASDIVSLHTPLLPETRHMIDAKRLQKFKPGAVLINAARGPLVDEIALAAALQSGHLGAAGLDVFEAEPNIHEVLLACETAVLTPHIGSATEACRRDIVMRGLQNIMAFFETGTPLDGVV
jgi:glyoxylate reductase